MKLEDQIKSATTWMKQWSEVTSALIQTRTHFTIAHASMHKYFDAIKRDAKKIQTESIRKLELDSINDQLKPWDSLNDEFVTSGGRVLNVVGFGDDLKTAIKHAYQAVDKINFDEKFFRKDIGKKGLSYK